MLPPLQRTAYLAYYMKAMDFPRLRRFAAFAARTSGLSTPRLYADAVRCAYQYNISPLDYFFFRFYEQGSSGRDTWAGTGYMYEYQRRMNPPAARAVLENKIRFLARFARFVQRPFATRQQIKDNQKAARTLLDSVSGRIVLKGAMGQCGQEVSVRETAALTSESLLALMCQDGFDLAEGYVIQHPDLMRLSPSGLNTVRLFTQLLADGTVVLLGARLRVTVNSAVDNLAAGNFATPVDSDTGFVCGPGVYSDITKPDVEVHPVTGVSICNFQVPLWDQVLNMVRAAAQLSPENRSVGWDVGITSNGPELIEGNHNWCKLLWQMPVKRGLKHLLEGYK